MTTFTTFATFAELTERAWQLVDSQQRAVLAIVGPPGSGKSTLTAALLNELRRTPRPGATDDWVAHLPMDGFHLADVQLDRLGRRDRKGAVDTFDAAGFVATLRRVRDRSDAVVYVPGFDRELEQPMSATVAIPREARLVIVEGLYLLHDEGEWAGVAGCFDESWFCSIDDGVRVQRLTARHVVFGKSPEEARVWVDRVDEPNAAVVTRSRSRATRVVNLDRLEIPRPAQHQPRTVLREHNGIRPPPATVWP